MELGTFKPVLSALVLPPAGPLLLAAAGLLALRRWRRSGTAAVLAGLALLWLLSCHAFALELARLALPLPAPIDAARLQTTQAIIVLGGGVSPEAPEYGSAQPSAVTLNRLRYGIWLARSSGKPLAFAGGVGWAAQGTGAPTEGEVARRVAREEFGQTLRWVDDQSRDTRENARRIAALLQRDGVTAAALVTDALHMTRAVREFRAAGLEVVPAPTQLPTWRERGLLEWLPSAEGLVLSRYVLRERLALAFTPDLP
jgi:uncharacterized SAM-binding protein YcdF (DUF218 family)